MSNFITLEQAVAMTKTYRENKENILAQQYQGMGILPICETFDSSSFTTLLNESGCAAIRVYLGMDSDLKVRLVAVGVNQNGEDILPASDSNKLEDGGGNIVEDGIRCPDICPPTSPLNT